MDCMLYLWNDDRCTKYVGNGSSEQENCKRGTNEPVFECGFLE